jgi:hypothetical protein
LPQKTAAENSVGITPTAKLDTVATPGQNVSFVMRIAAAVVYAVNVAFVQVVALVAVVTRNENLKKRFTEGNGFLFGGDFLKRCGFGGSSQKDLSANSDSRRGQSGGRSSDQSASNGQGQSGGGATGDSIPDAPEDAPAVSETLSSAEKDETETEEEIPEKTVEDTVAAEAAKRLEAARASLGEASEEAQAVINERGGDTENLAGPVAAVFNGLQELVAEAAGVMASGDVAPMDTLAKTLRETVATFQSVERLWRAIEQAEPIIAGAREGGTSSDNLELQALQNAVDAARAGEDTHEFGNLTKRIEEAMAAWQSAADAFSAAMARLEKSLANAEETLGLAKECGSQMGEMLAQHAADVRT